jgi:hypothetical protein
MKIMHQNGFSQQECASFTDIVHVSIIKAIKALVYASRQLNIPIEEPNNQRAEKVNDMDEERLDLSTNIKLLTQEMGSEIALLWNDAGIKKTFERRNEFQLDDSTLYYMTNIDRITDPSYIPSQEDVLRTRVKTVGVIEMTYELKNKTVRILDIGGQRTERKKWMHCFEGVDAAIFVTSASEYDTKCYEDGETPRLSCVDLFFSYL